MQPPLERDYRPLDTDLRHCVRCGQWCLPYPCQDSVVCSWCYFQLHKKGEPTHEP
jgi:hypothetical protein